MASRSHWYCCLSSSRGVYKPTLVISIHDGVGKGSCRSIDGFNIYDALKSCEDILLQFGGHAAAAGFSIDANRIDELRER